MNPVVYKPPREDPAVLAERWRKSIAFVKRWVGEHVWDSRDPKSESRFGISRREYPKVRISKLTWGIAEAIYKRDFWKVLGADELPWPLCLTHFDFAVSAGIGPARQALVQSGGDFDRYNEARRKFYQDSPKYPYLGKEWMRRVNEVEALGREENECGL